jgi:hypothetical protein
MQHLSMLPNFHFKNGRKFEVLVVLVVAFVAVIVVLVVALLVVLVVDFTHLHSH